MKQLTLDKNNKYLLACSYGPDSMALFYLLQSQGYDFDCAIVNYHLRKESDKEVKGLIDYASKFNIKVHVLDYKGKILGNTEATCRYIRYDYFHELTTHFKYDATLVAHHQDDLIETYLLQKNRQNCPIFFGIKEDTIINKVHIIRPLLSFSKQELLEICKSNKVPFSIDVSNYDLSIKRNEIRLNYVSNLTPEKRLKIIKEIDDKNKQLENMFERLNKLDLNSAKTILSLSELEQKYALNFVCEKTCYNFKLSKANVGQVINILKSSKPNGNFPINRIIHLLKEYDFFYFVDERTFSLNSSYSFIINEPLKLDNEFFYLDFTGNTSNRNVFKSDYPLTIRPVQKEDTYIINNYEVTANRLLIDWKVPYRLRMVWPVIVNKDGKVIYIPRYRKDFIPDRDCNFYVKPIK